MARNSTGVDPPGVSSPTKDTPSGLLRPLLVRTGRKRLIGAEIGGTDVCEDEILGRNRTACQPP